MGRIADILLGRRPDYLASPALLSPFAEHGTLGAYTAGQLFDSADSVADAIPLTRDSAMRIPAVSKGRNLLVSTIAGLPLLAMTKAGPLSDDAQPTWLYRTNGIVSPYSRMAWTVDDLIFYGQSLWFLERGSGGQIVEATWVPTSEWTITDGHILVNEQEVDETEVLLFDSPIQGLLGTASPTLKGAIDIERAWTGRARNPVPIMVLRLTGEGSLEDDEIIKLRDNFAKQRLDPNGSVSVLPPGVTLDVHGEVDPKLMQEGRNGIRVDVGSFLGIPPSYMDGAIQETSVVYQNQQGTRNVFYETCIPQWIQPIEAALSQDSIVPRGQRVRFDRSEFYTPVPTATGAPAAD
jgi:hypothetical protein